MGTLRHAKLFCSTGSEALRKICAGEQDVKTVHVPGCFMVYGFGVSELPLDDQKRMLCFASYGRFPVLDLLVPVDTFVTGRSLKTRWPDIGSELDLLEMPAVSDLRSLFSSAISGISAADLVIFPKEALLFHADTVPVFDTSIIYYTGLTRLLKPEMMI